MAGRYLLDTNVVIPLLIPIRPEDVVKYPGTQTEVGNDSRATLSDRVAGGRHAGGAQGRLSGGARPGAPDAAARAVAAAGGLDARRGGGRGGRGLPVGPTGG